MAISRNKQKRSRQPVVRSRRAGTSVVDRRVPADDRSYTDVEVDQYGRLVTASNTLPRG